MEITLLDFSKPPPLSVEWNHRLMNWFQSALALAEKSWAKEFTVPLKGSVQNLDHCYARQGLSRLSEDTLVYRIKLGDRLVSFLVLPRKLMLNLTGTLLGESDPASDRELTLIEEKLGDYFLIHYWLNFFRESWPGPAKVSWTLEGREAIFRGGSTIADAEVLLAMNWQMGGPNGGTNGIWYFPRKGLLDLLSTPAGPGQEPLSENGVASRRETIVHQLPLSVEVVLGSTELRLSELSSLQVGDIVLLDQCAAVGAFARACGQDLFHGQVGRVGSQKAFQIEVNVIK